MPASATTCQYPGHPEARDPTRSDHATPPRRSRASTPSWIVPVEPAGALAGHVAGRRRRPDRRRRARAQLPHARLRCRATALRSRGTSYCPGLVNAHTHTAMTLLRGIADDVPLAAWLEQHIWPREAAFVSPEFVHDGTLLGAAEMLRGGMTCCNDMYFYPGRCGTRLSRARACARCSACRSSTSRRRTRAMPTPTCTRASRRAMRSSTRHASRSSLAPHAPYTVGDATFAKIVTYAHQLDLPIQTHLQETRHELDACDRARPGVAARAARPARRDRTVVRRHPRRAPRRRATSRSWRATVATSCIARRRT